MAAANVHSDFGAQQSKVMHCFIVSPSIVHEVMAPDAMILVFGTFSFRPFFILVFHLHHESV